MKPIDVKSSTYFDFEVKSNDKDPKFKVGNQVKISKNQNIFAKGYTQYWPEENFVIEKVKNTVWTYKILFEKEKQKANQTEFRTEKVIKEKDGKSYVK